MNRKKIFFLILIVLSLAAVALLWGNAVDKSITEEDKQYIPLYTADIRSPLERGNYESEIDFIIQVQNSVLTVAPVNKGLPFSAEREPKNLYEAKVGLCFDRSRVIEKILHYHGFQVRHIFIYSIKQTNSSLQSFVTPHVPSHAVTEVLTAKGWLVIDSNARWISTDADGNPKSMRELTDNFNQSGNLVWKQTPPVIYADIAPYTFIYGLYSRHGKFYPPYNFIPDVNYSEFVDNIF